MGSRSSLLNANGYCSFLEDLAASQVAYGNGITGLKSLRRASFLYEPFRPRLFSRVRLLRRVSRCRQMRIRYFDFCCGSPVYFAVVFRRATSPASALRVQEAHFQILSTYFQRFKSREFSDDLFALKQGKPSPAKTKLGNLLVFRTAFAPKTEGFTAFP